MIVGIQQAFENCRDEYLKFDRLQHRNHECRFLCAFLILDHLVHSSGPIIAATDLELIFLSTNCNFLASVATYQDIVNLMRCGVKYNRQFDCLEMRV